MKKALFFAFMDFLPVTMTGQRWVVLSVFMNQSMPNRPSPPPRYLTGVFFCTAGNLAQNEARPVRHWLSFQNADQHCKQKDFVIFSAFCMKRCVQRSLLLYSLICWSIWEPLKKPINCWLCGMNNFKGGYYHIPVKHCGQFTILSNGWNPVWLISKCCHGGK